jgi:hypothetical protein
MENEMTQVPTYVWDAFCHAQTTSSRTTISNITWAADEAGDAILDMIEHGAVPSCPDVFRRQFGNLMINRAGKHRRRAAIKALHYDPLHANERSEPLFEAIAARSMLRKIEAKSKATDWSLLLRIGMGARMAEIASSLGSTETAVKKRVARARERIAA